jgi:hypothetical protein
MEEKNEIKKSNVPELLKKDMQIHYLLDLLAKSEERNLEYQDRRSTFWAIVKIFFFSILFFIFLDFVVGSFNR